MTVSDIQTLGVHYSARAKLTIATGNSEPPYNQSPSSKEGKQYGTQHKWHWTCAGEVHYIFFTLPSLEAG